jgi:SagB-type dehydrogenase family enzyme
MSAAIRYHQATKYSPESIGAHPGLDWERQPVPYKDYDCLMPIELAPYLPFDPNPFTGLGRTAQGVPSDGEISLNTLGRWLFATYGITGVIPNQPRPTYLRAAPSAGGLYPAEIYLAVRACQQLPAGLYGYDPRRHRLIPLWEGDDIYQHLVQACYGNAAIAASPVSLVVTGIFERSRWRYGERAYRRILLDSGHLLGNACLMAPALGLRLHLTGAFCDQRLVDLMRLDADQEGPLAVVGLNTRGVAERPSWSALPSALTSESAAEATSDEPSPFLSRLHRLSCLPPERPRLIPGGDELQAQLAARYGWSSGISMQADARALGTAGNLAQDPFSSIVQRRSTRRFSRATMSRSQLARILGCGYDPEAMGLGEQPAFERSRLMTFVAVVAVEGLEAGVYYLAPHGLELRLVRKGCSRQALQFLCLSQELGGDAAAVVFHTADLQAAVGLFGDRSYRYLHLDAGLIGERLSLSALNVGAGASGIGGFFDDQVTELLGIPSEQAVIYVTTLGIPETAADDSE